MEYNTAYSNELMLRDGESIGASNLRGVLGQDDSYLGILDELVIQDVVDELHTQDEVAPFVGRVR